MTVAEAIPVLQGMDPRASLCVMAKDDEGDSYSDPVDDIVAIGHEVLLVSSGTMP